MKLFDQNAYKLHQRRAQITFHEHDFLFNHVGSELTSRVKDIKRNFNNSLNLSPHLLKIPGEIIHSTNDEVTYKDGQFDLIVSCLLGHWVNDVPSFLKDIHRCLKPSGIFQGAVLGGNTLFELRESLLQAEISITGGVSPRVSPFIHAGDLSTLMTRAGFVIPVIDIETVTVTYSSLYNLMRDLRGMGETNCLNDRLKTFTTKRLFDRAEIIYNAMYKKEDKIPATFEIIFLTGWKNPQT